MKKEPKPDIAEMILKVQEQLALLEKKMDALTGVIGQSQRPPARNFDRPRHQGDMRQDNNYRERVLHKAVCADCSKECEVPFKPTGDRPVYCKDCFSKRKAANPFKGPYPEKPKEHFARERHAAPRKPLTSEEYYKEKNRAFIEKKKAGPKKRKKFRGSK